MGVESGSNNISTPSLALPLMELLAIRLSWQTTPAKSLVMQGGGDKEPNGIFGMPQNQFATEHTEKVVADFMPREIDELLFSVLSVNSVAKRVL
jgi:hypothetical protein